MPPTQTWKQKERELAALFGTVRRALSGGNSSQGNRRDDAHHPHIFLECKYAARHAVWKLWRFAKSCCQKELRHPKRRPVLGLYARGESGALLVVHENDLIVVTLNRLRTLRVNLVPADPKRAAEVSSAIAYLERIQDV